VTVDTDDENGGPGGTSALGTGTRPRGAVTIGGNAAGAVVVVVVDGDVDVVVDGCVVVERGLVVEDDVTGTVRALSDELHAAHAATSSTHTLIRPKPRCTRS
jgi:hypothetical protein